MIIEDTGKVDGEKNTIHGKDTKQSKYKAVKMQSRFLQSGCQQSLIGTGKNFRSNINFHFKAKTCYQGNPAFEFHRKLFNTNFSAGL